VRAQLRKDDGAVAIMVAILTIVLVGMAAFATDFGLAYANKRNLQKAADAAALAAAGAVISNLTSPNEGCASVAARFTANTGNLRTTLQTLADSIASQNNNRSTRTGMTVACSADNKRIEVSYSNTGTTPALLGGVFGASNVNASRTATADVFTSPSGFGLRPYALCILDEAALLAAQNTSTKWVKVNYPNAGCGSYGGNWYSLNCPGDGNNGLLDTNTLNGCSTEVGIIPQFDSAGLALAQSTINASISSQCTSAASRTQVIPADCMLADPGNLASNGITSAWDVLLTKPSITVPVFDPTWNTFADTSVPACKSGGNNGCYPIKAIAAVKVCAYRFQNKKSTVAPDSICPGLTQAMVNAGPNRDALWIALTAPIQNQGTSGPSGGAVGDGSNVLGTRLIQ